jgi:hypothetical protein
METGNSPTITREPWNKGKLVGRPQSAIWPAKVPGLLLVKRQSKGKHENDTRPS